MGSKKVLAPVLLSLLVFEHGFIQIRFGSFEFFYTISFLLNFTRYLFSENFSRYLSQFFIDEKHYAMNVGYWSKSISWKYFIFHEMTLKLYLMKCPERKISQCILPLRKFLEQHCIKDQHCANIEITVNIVMDIAYEI